MARTVPIRVAILGGGVAGLSAAHELAERGIQVAVYEVREQFGGKARSIPHATPGVDERLPLPGEHGFRIVPSFYHHLPDTMRRIPSRRPGRSVYQQLVSTHAFALATTERPLVRLRTSFPTALLGIRRLATTILRGFVLEIEMTLDELSFFGDKLFQVMTSCKARREREYETVDWYDFVGAKTRTPGYGRFVAASLACGLAAVRPRRANTKVQGDLIVQLLLSLLRPRVSAIRLLNGPTSDVWIEPWCDYLRRRGVALHGGYCLKRLDTADGRISRAVLRHAASGTESQVEADYYILAVPVEKAAELLRNGHNDHLLSLDPGLKRILKLQEAVDWMSGVIFYLARDIKLNPGHILYIDSPWALTSVSQPQFWPAVDLARYGNGRVKGIISVCLSNWHEPGILFHKPARECTRDEIRQEVWAQLKMAVNRLEHPEQLSNNDLLDWFLDPDIEDIQDHTGAQRVRYENAEPLLVAEVNTGPLRPDAATRIPNLFLASDYVKTNTQLPSMEAANEAARRAVNGILKASRSRHKPCRIWSLDEPWLLAPWRWYDAFRFARGQPWSPTPGVLNFAQWVLLLAYHLLVRVPHPSLPRRRPRAA